LGSIKRKEVIDLSGDLLFWSRDGSVPENERYASRAASRAVAPVGRKRDFKMRNDKKENRDEHGREFDSHGRNVGDGLNSDQGLRFNDRLRA